VYWLAVFKIKGVREGERGNLRVINLLKWSPEKFFGFSLSYLKVIVLSFL
jgi:hypothetical protein